MAINTMKNATDNQNITFMAGLNLVLNLAVSLPDPIFHTPF